MSFQAPENRWLLAARVVRNLTLAAVLGTVAGGVVVMGRPASLDLVPTGTAWDVARTIHAAELAREHGCWGPVNPDLEPPDEIPGGVIWDVGNAWPVYNRHAAAAGAALDHVFGDEQVPGLQVWAFCLGGGA